MKIEYTNFDGDWSERCPYCNELQKTHQVDAGEVDGTKYIHRLPCEDEKYQIRKMAVKRGIVNRLIFSVIDITTYIWGLIPFKELFKLIYSLLKNIYKSITAVIYLLKSKPK